MQDHTCQVLGCLPSDRRVEVKERLLGLLPPKGVEIPPSGGERCEASAGAAARQAARMAALLTLTLTLTLTKTLTLTWMAMQFSSRRRSSDPRAISSVRRASWLGLGLG